MADLKTNALISLIDELTDDSMEVALMNIIQGTTESNAEHFTVISSHWNLKNNNKSKDKVTIKDYVEFTVPKYSDMEFKSHFRMSRTRFQELLCILSNNIIGLSVGTSRIPLDKALLLTLWTLATPESFRSVADRFGLSNGVSHYLYIKICKYICGLSKQFIQWPSLPEMRSSSEIFLERWQFPGVFGAVDGSHIPIKEPVVNKESYYNRKGFTSIILQATCNENMKFIDVSIGSPGSMHDARVLKTSNLFKFINSNLPPPDLHLVGDSAYPLTPWLMTPYRDNGHLTLQKKRYNFIHSKSRCVIERAFAQLKGKFRRLKYLDMNNFTYMTTVVLACCILHNFILTDEDYDDTNYESDPEIDSVSYIEESSLSNNPAMSKREEISNAL